MKYALSTKPLLFNEEDYNFKNYDSCTNCFCEIASEANHLTISHTVINDEPEFIGSDLIALEFKKKGSIFELFQDSFFAKYSSVWILRDKCNEIDSDLPDDTWITVIFHLETQITDIEDYKKILVYLCRLFPSVETDCLYIFNSIDLPLDKFFVNKGDFIPKQVIDQILNNNEVINDAE